MEQLKRLHRAMTFGAVILGLWGWGAEPVALARALCPPSFKTLLKTERAPNATPNPAKDYRTRGYFVSASEEQHEALAARLKQNGVTKQLDGDIRRVGEKDLAVDFNKLSAKGFAELLEIGRRNMKDLYYFTSGAGLWSRGGGQVKALIPFNIKELLSAEEFEKLVHSGTVASASSAEDVLKAAFPHVEIPKTVDIEKYAAEIVQEHQKVLEQLISKARKNPRSMTPIDIKMANVATGSERGKTYVPFDIWTSEQTHQPIAQYLDEFKKTYHKKVFHPDAATDANIKRAIGKYIRESEIRGETHLFGFQEGYHALERGTGAAARDTPLIGEGAGMAKAYLEASGRAEQLRRMGKKTWVFENIEVLTDLSLGLGAHIKTGKPVSVILVPQKEGYSGGSPFQVPKNGGHNLELHEMSALPKEFAEGNEFFNSNTIFQSLDLRPPTNIGFEEKTFRGRKIVRVKMNAGDVTLDNPTAGVGGRIGVEYENFKNYKEFGLNGNNLVNTFQRIWARDALPPPSTSAGRVIFGTRAGAAGQSEDNADKDQKARKSGP